MFDTDSAAPPDAQAQETTTVDDAVIIARGRINNAKKLFASRGWKILPDTERGRRILRWFLDQTWVSSPEKYRTSRVRRACDRWAPWLSLDERTTMVERTKTSNKKWTHDQSAIVLELTLDENWKNGFRFLGACDDPDRDRREERRRKLGTARSRKYRAEHSTGRKRGRQPLQMTPEERKAHRREQQDRSKRKCRMATKNAQRSLSNNTSSVTDLMSPSITVIPVSNIVLLAARSILISKATTIPIELRKAA